MDWDIFISHASEDKESFVRPLALELKKRGLRVWYDEFSLSVGDSLREAIDKGLTNSRFGAVVLSTNFLQKVWPRKELAGLISKEGAGEKVVLPIWLGLQFEEVQQFSPILADKFALNSAVGIREVASKLLEIVRPELCRLQDEKVRDLVQRWQRLDKNEESLFLMEVISRLKRVVWFNNEYDERVQMLLEHGNGSDDDERPLRGLRESLYTKYNIPDQIWAIHGDGHINNSWVVSVERLIRKWTRGKATEEECWWLYDALDEDYDFDVYFILFGFPRFAISEGCRTIDENFVRLGTRNLQRASPIIGKP